MSKYGASARVVGIVAGVIVLVLGLSVSSAVAWNKCKDKKGGEEGMASPPTADKPGPSKGHDEYPKDEEKPKESKPPAEEQPPVVSPAPEVPVESPPVSTGLLPGTTPVAPASPTPAPAVESSPTPVPETASSPTPAPEVKGAIGTSWRADSGAPTVLAAADVQPAGLARTGLDVLPLGLLAALALGGSAFLFRRTRRC